MRRYFIGHAIAYLPMLCVAIYIAYFQVRKEAVPYAEYIGPLAVLCCITFFIGLIIRDTKKADKKETEEVPK